MVLELIYVARHGFRSNWVVNPTTGDYTAYVRTPTGIPADPALTSHGVDQAQELATHLRRLPESGGEHGSSAFLPVERIYCSPYYRCLQTVQPFVEQAAAVEGEKQAEKNKGGQQDEKEPIASPWWSVRCEPGLVDWFGPAPFEQPQPAPLSLLRDRFFPWIDPAYAPSSAVPPRRGESMAQLHARVAAALDHVVRQCDAEGVRAVLICSHAAPIIALGRVLTGQLPDDVETEDFGTFTCGLSVYRRRRRHRGRQQQQQPPPSPPPPPPPFFNEEPNKQQQGLDTDDASIVLPTHVPPWDDQFHTLARQTWTRGRGVGGGWECEVNCDCSFLSEGEERGWRFSGDDESFAGVEPEGAGGPIVDAGLELGVVVEGRSTGRAQATKTLPLQGGKDRGGDGGHSSYGGRGSITGGGGGRGKTGSRL